ncbi:hypothetical protein ACF0H5_006305 [Mactra antiquata]
MSILYISKIGPGTKSFLLEEYDKTDKAFEDMWSWPEEFAYHPNETFRTKAKLIRYINFHRTKLDPTTSDVYGEIDFYSDIVNFFMDWMIERIRESGFGDTWKSLVVFQKITRCLLDSGAERAYGAMFFAQGNFLNGDLYDNYFRRIFRFSYNYRSASYYSDLVDPLLDQRTEQQEYTRSIRSLRDEIKYSNFSGDYQSAIKAQDYFDNASFRVDYLSGLQSQVASRVINNVNATVRNFVSNIIIYGVTATIVIISFPLIVFFTEALTSNMQAYSKVLAKASNELNQEKTRTESLIYQMLPRSVAERLKRKSKVDSEFFKSATIMFTSIVDFTQLSIEYTPMELVSLLNVLYSLIDETIEKYDVYKVETINDTYMVVSGVPTPNGSRHASEIAYLALNIVSLVKEKAMVPRNMNIPIQLLVGVNTGSVSAGVVGTIMLRYCLFGDTVNTASRMRSYSQPNQIHISDTTHKNLKKTGFFKMQSRGLVVVKGKGSMNTYWLIDAVSRSISGAEPTDWHLPGEADLRGDSPSVSSNTDKGFEHKEKIGAAKGSKGRYRRKSTQQKDHIATDSPKSSLNRQKLIEEEWF